MFIYYIRVYAVNNIYICVPIIVAGNLGQYELLNKCYNKSIRRGKQSSQLLIKLQNVGKQSEIVSLKYGTNFKCTYIQLGILCRKHTIKSGIVRYTKLLSTNLIFMRFRYLLDF